jgi:hypothetical protein
MSPSPSDSVRSFAVLAEPDVGLPARVLDQFTKRDLLPDRFEARRSGDALTIEVDCSGLEDDVAGHVRDVLATFVRVARVDLGTRARRAA